MTNLFKIKINKYKSCFKLNKSFLRFELLFYGSHVDELEITIFDHEQITLFWCRPKESIEEPVNENYRKNKKIFKKSFNFN